MYRYLGSKVSPNRATTFGQNSIPTVTKIERQSEAPIVKHHWAKVNPNCGFVPRMRGASAMSSCNQFVSTTNTARAMILVDTSSHFDAGCVVRLHAARCPCTSVSLSLERLAEMAQHDHQLQQQPPQQQHHDHQLQQLHYQATSPRPAPGPRQGPNFGLAACATARPCAAVSRALSVQSSCFQRFRADLRAGNRPPGFSACPRRRRS